MEIPEPRLERFEEIVPHQIINDLLCYNPFHVGSGGWLVGLGAGNVQIVLCSLVGVVFWMEWFKVGGGVEVK